MLIDEVANVAPLCDLRRFLSQAGGHGFVRPSLGHLRERYGPAADTSLGNLTSKLLMGPTTDHATQ